MKSEQLRSATEIEKAYLAGIIDADGCVGATRYKRSAQDKDEREGKGRGRYAMFTVFVAMCDRQAVELMLEIYGGHIREKRDKRGDHARRILYCWQGYSEIGARVLRDVLPYLRVKHEQARIYISAMKTMTGGPRKGHQGSVSPSPEDLAQRYTYVEQIQRLNQRGVFAR